MTGYKVFMGDLQLPVSFADDHHENKRTEQRDHAGGHHEYEQYENDETRRDLFQSRTAGGAVQLCRRSATGHESHVRVQRPDDEENDKGKPDQNAGRLTVNISATASGKTGTKSPKSLNRN